MKELLLEIGTEEIPAGFVRQALVDIESLTRKELEAQRIDFEGMKTLGTPRRLVLVIGGLSERQRDVEIKKVGPRSRRPLTPTEIRPGRPSVLQKDRALPWNP